MIIDCHGHYTTAPSALEAWRERQIAGIDLTVFSPRVSFMAHHIGDFAVSSQWAARAVYPRLDTRPVKAGR